MFKKGVSPLIATVLLVGIAVVLATLLSYFVKNLTEKQSEESESKLFLGQVCIEDVKVEYKSFCFIDNPTDPETIKITIQNKAEIPIVEFAFKTLGDQVQVTNSQTQLGAYATNDYNINYIGPIIDPGNGAAREIRNLDILVKKKIDYQDITGFCDDDELKTTVIYECPPP